MRGPGKYDASRLTDSSLVYLRSPPGFIRMFVIFVIIFLIMTAAWACITVKAQEVKIQGSVSSEDATNVFSQVNGTISRIYVEEGESVVYGQNLLQFDSTEVEIQLQGFLEKKYQYTALTEYNKRMSDQISGPNIHTNPFGTTTDLEKDYYDIYQTFLHRLDHTDADQVNQLISGELQVRESEYLEYSKLKLDNENNYNKTLDELSKYNIVSNTTGVVHYEDDFKEGFTFQPGAKICTINPENSVKKVVAYISSQDRAKVSVGQKCHFTVDGLAQSDFGSVDGVLETISSDATAREDQIIFRCEISFDKTKLVGDRGYEVAIVNGMSVSAWVVYEETTYMDYFIEKLGFKHH